MQPLIFRPPTALRNVNVLVRGRYRQMAQRFTVFPSLAQQSRKLVVEMRTATVVVVVRVSPRLCVVRMHGGRRSGLRKRWLTGTGQRWVYYSRQSDERAEWDAAKMKVANIHLLFFFQISCQLRRRTVCSSTSSCLLVDSFQAGRSNDSSAGAFLCAVDASYALARTVSVFLWQTVGRRGKNRPLLYCDERLMAPLSKTVNNVT